MGAPRRASFLCDLHVRTQREVSSLQQALTRTRPCCHLDLGLPASRTVSHRPPSLWHSCDSSPSCPRQCCTEFFSRVQKRLGERVSTHLTARLCCWARAPPGMGQTQHAVSSPPRTARDCLQHGRDQLGREARRHELLCCLKEFC